MSQHTQNLNLILPLGSKYWNLDTWNENMEILDEAFLDIQHDIDLRLTAQNTSLSPINYINSTNMQSGTDELYSKSSSLRFIEVDENMTIQIPAEAHSYLILTFGETVYDVHFVKTPLDSTRQFVWLNNQPTFEANSTYEISFLYLGGIWIKRAEALDYSQFFEYYIEDNILYVTKVKADDWYAYFGNYDIVIPSNMLGKQVMIDNYPSQ